MIELTLRDALIFYSLVLFVLIAGIWLYTELTVRRYHRFLGKQYLWRCVFCGFVYLDERAERVSKCPRCGSFNSTSDKGAREVRDHDKIARRTDERQDDASQHTTRRNPSRRKRPHQRRRGPRRH